MGFGGAEPSAEIVQSVDGDLPRPPLELLKDPAVEQWAAVIVSLLRVTAPLRAKARPAIVTLLLTEIDVRVRMFPVNTEVVPSVAELPTCQKTLHGRAPLMSLTWLQDAVIRVEPAWKMKTASGLP